jgi:hypothetical protein
MPPDQQDHAQEKCNSNAPTVGPTWIGWIDNDTNKWITDFRQLIQGSDSYWFIRYRLILGYKLTPDRVCCICPDKQWDDTRMTPEEALRHEQGEEHAQSRAEGEREAVVSDWEGSTSGKKGWGERTGLGALDNRKYEGSLGTMQVRIASWMRGLELAAKGEKVDGWKMEDDYQVEEYPPLDEWTQGWGETWALSSAASSTPPAERGKRAIGPVLGMVSLRWTDLVAAHCSGDEQFLGQIDRRKHPSDRLQNRWQEFSQVRFRMAG